MDMAGTESRLAAYYSGLFKTEGAVRLDPEEDISCKPVINGPEGEYALEFQLMLGLDADSIAGRKTKLPFQQVAELFTDDQCN